MKILPKTLFAKDSSIPLKIGQDGSISHNELCDVGPLDLESLSVCMKMMASQSQA